MRTLIKVIIGLLVLGTSSVGIVFYLTSDMVGVADKFFAEVKKGNLQVAYSDLAKNFQSTTTKEELEAFLKSSGLMDAKEASWSSRSFEGSQGRIEGTVSTDSGATIPLSISFVKEDGSWRILGMERAAAGILNSKDSPKLVPAEGELLEILKGTTASFGSAVQTKSFSEFHRTISELWQSQFTEQMLEEAYRSLYGVEAQWNTIHNLTPTIEAATILDENGVLVVDGFYPTQPDQLVFTYKYIEEHGEWKLLGLHIRFRADRLN